jgi:hypothetical protein
MTLNLGQLLDELQTIADEHGETLPVYSGGNQDLVRIEYSDDEGECVVLSFV